MKRKPASYNATREFQAARERRLLETPTMTKAQLSIVFALAAWPAVALAEGLFFGVTGLPLFSPVEGAVFTRVFLALGFAVVAGTAYREYSS